MNAILKRNDTLFIAGKFTSAEGRNRYGFVMYETDGTIIDYAGNGGFENFYAINAIAIHNDTIIYAGRAQWGTENIRKYDFRTFTPLSWGTPFVDNEEVININLSEDGNTIVYAATESGKLLKGVSNITGALLYQIDVRLTITTGLNSPFVHGIKSFAGKTYIYGRFDEVYKNSATTYRKNFFALNTTTGTITPDDLNLDGFVSFALLKGNDLYLSGRFSTINGTGREQFASLNAATLAVNNFHISPSDPIRAMDFYNNQLYIAGDFTGLNSKRRIGSASIDIETRQLSSWNVPLEYLWKRSVIHGDTLFVLSYFGSSETCYTDESIYLKIYSISTGTQLGLGELNYKAETDLLIDGNYLYVTEYGTLHRYSLPGLVRDQQWNPILSMNGHEIFIDSTRVYVIAHGNFPNCNPTSAYIRVFNKTNGSYITQYNYSGLTTNDVVSFRHGLKSGNKLYVQGKFKNVNGLNRSNFLCIDLTNGSITNWQPTFALASDANSFTFTSALKLHKGKIWFSGRTQETNGEGTFGGLGGIDTTTAAFVNPFVTKIKYEAILGGGTIHDFLLSDSAIVLAGQFDSVNGRPFKNFAVFPLTGINQISFCANGSNSFTSDITGPSYQWQMDSGNGFVNIADNINFSGTQSATLQLFNIPTTWYEYKLRCYTGNTYSDVFEIKFKAIWTGAADHNWENPANWNCGIVPDANTDVVINNGATVVISVNTTISSLTLNSGAILTINPGVQLTIIH